MLLVVSTVQVYSDALSRAILGALVLAMEEQLPENRKLSYSLIRNFSTRLLA